MIASGELLLTRRTLEWLSSSMLPIVPGKLVRPGELPMAIVPRADVRLFSSVGPLMSLEMRALGIHLVAVLLIAAVDLSSLETRFGSLQ